MTDNPTLRAALGAALAVGAWLVSFCFYGTGLNFIVLAYVAALLLLAISTIGASRIAETLRDNPVPLGFAFAALGYLVVAYRTSLSPDNSFAPSWVLAAGPFAFLCGIVLFRFDTLSRYSTNVVVAVVVALAAISSVRFLILGERAFQPLLDANNYGMLLYLIWIPFVHAALVRVWRSDAAGRQRLLLSLLATFVLTLAIFATRSRTSTLAVVGAFVFWSALTFARGLAWRPLLMHAVVAGVSAIAWVVATSMHGNQPNSLEFAGGLSVRGELLRAAFAMLRQHPVGIGVFCFPLLYPSFRSPLEQDTAGLFVHNDYVQFLVEGGLPLMLFLLAFAFSILRRTVGGIRAALNEAAFDRLGIAVALLAVCAHAAVNFVFYTLPLGLLIGFMAARLFSKPNSSTLSIGASPAQRRAIALAIVMGWVMWSYLALDVMTIGVFQGQAGIPFATSIRGDDSRMLEFSRVAQRLNGSRGIPALGEAMLLEKAALAEPGSRYLREQAYRQFHIAMSIDPWNPMVYSQFAHFLDALGLRVRAPGESSEDLLVASISLDPLYLPGIDGLLALYAAHGDDAKRYALLRNVVYPWMPTVHKRDPAASDRYFELLKGYAVTYGDTPLLTSLEEQQQRLAHFVPVAPAYWFL